MEGGPPKSPRDSTCPTVLGWSEGTFRVFAYGTVTLSGRPFQAGSANLEVPREALEPPARLPRPPTQNGQGLSCAGFRLFPFRSPLLGESRLISFPRGTKMFQFPRLPSGESRMTRVLRAGLPHSDIPGSKPACGYPRLIAACHVLHRPLVPRHPPYALSSLITSSLWLYLFKVHGGDERNRTAALLLARQALSL